MGSHRLYYGITLVALGTVAASFAYLAGWEPDSVLARVLVVLGAFTAFAASRVGTWLKADTYPRQALPGGANDIRANDIGAIPAATLLGTGAYFASGHGGSSCDAGGQGGGSCDGGGCCC